MVTTRRRWRSMAEWAVAVALLTGSVGIGLTLQGEIWRVAPIPSVIALESDPTLPSAAIPPRAVSVPLLSLADGVRIQVGEVASDALSRLQGLVDAGTDIGERTAGGERTTREFRWGGGRFYLITGPSAEGTTARVTGIFIP